MATSEPYCAVWFAGLAAFLATGCYHHQRSPESPPLPRWRPSLPESQRGSYAVRGPHGIEGVETFTVTSSSAEWTLRSERRSGGGLESFELRIDPRTAEPTAFVFWRELEGLRRTVRGERRDGWFEVTSSGVGGVSTQRISYAPGTMVDGPSPALKGPYLALLALQPTQGRAVPVRTIRIDGPQLRPRVVLSTFEVRGEDGPNLLVRLSRSGEPDVGLWVRSDGWPIRARALDRQRRPSWTWKLRPQAKRSATVTERSSSRSR